MQLIAEHLDRIDCETKNETENEKENANNNNTENNKNTEEDQVVLPCSSRIYLDTILFVSLKNGGSFDSATDEGNSVARVVYYVVHVVGKIKKLCYIIYTYCYTKFSVYFFRIVIPRAFSNA